MTDKCYVIPTQSACNAKCVFCITKKRDYSSTPDFMTICNDFQKSLQILKNNKINRFEITGGGEPFLNKNLQEIIDEIRLNNPTAFIKLYTNGNIRRKVTGINELNISVTHWEKEINDKFMRITDSLDLDETLKFYSQNKSYAIRLSVPLLKGGIDSAQKADELIKRTENFVDRYVFRPLFDKTPQRDEYFVDFEYSHPKVEMDRYCSFDDKVLVWWTDNTIYTKWDLSEKCR